MEHIKQAVELARARSAAQPQPSPSSSPPLPPKVPVGSTAKGEALAKAQAITLDPLHLETMRVVSHDVMDWRAKPFDILRTQVLHAMNQHKWHFLALTSPSPACGKTVTAVNLGLSIARQPEKQILLIDMDLQRPRVAATLGLKCDKGLLSSLEGRTSISEAVVEVQVGHSRMSVLPCEASTSYSSDWMASREMTTLIQDVRQKFSSHTVIVDLPPILASNDVITIMPQVDCFLMVVAAGLSTPPDIEQASRYLQAAEVIRVVVTKVPEVATGYYGYHYQ